MYIKPNYLYIDRLPLQTMFTLSIYFHIVRVLFKL